MAWVHTWLGLAIGFPFLVVVFMGSLTLFDQELDRWMNPSLRHVEPQAVRYDELMARLDEIARPGSFRIVHPPSPRMPAIEVRFIERGKGPGPRYFDPVTLERLPKISGGGSYVFERLHDTLFVTGRGRVVLGFITLVALAVMIAGIWIHKGHFRNLFVWRREGSRGRSLVDLHTVASLVALPFHLLFTITGLWLVGEVVFPDTIRAVYERPSDFYSEGFGGYSRRPAGEEAKLASVDALAARAQSLWEIGAIGVVNIDHPGDRHALVRFEKTPDSRAIGGPRQLTFDGVDGTLLKDDTADAVSTLKRTLDEIHRLPYQSYTLRWLCFVLGMAGSVMVATGLLFWLEKRKSSRPSALHRAVEALTSSAICGMPIASAGLLALNRVLPESIGRRAEVEAIGFFAGWAALTLLVAAVTWRSGRAPWSGLCTLQALACLSAVTLNWWTTGDLPIPTHPSFVAAIAGVDLTLIGVAAIAIWSAIRLGAHRT